ncbi:hypothetical protein CYK37_01935 [Mesorhizobium loti]|nr:hypothetical protein [Mesorhizobium loti]PLP61078.1 hypothetical protein CYK37_01935 [Mesorhizobium loti]
MSKPTTETPEFTVADSGLMVKVFYAFAIVVVLSVAISAAGKWLGHSIAMGGYSDDTKVREVIIGNNVLAMPANFIRFEKARRNGDADRLDVYLRYPKMDGYSAAARDDFNNARGKRTVLFLTFEEQAMSRDMSGRYAPIYSSLIMQPGMPGPADTTIYGFTEKSGYLNETLVVAERPGQEPFVARCLAGPSAEQSLAPCERDVLVGDRLSLTYRFPKEFLADWPALDAAVLAFAARTLKTGAALKKRQAPQ